MEEREIGILIKQAIYEKKISLRQLGKEIGLDVSTLSRIVNNKQQPNIKHLEKISRALELPLEELLVASGYTIGHFSHSMQKVCEKIPVENEDIFEICSQFEGKELAGNIERELDKYGQYVSVPEGRAMVREGFRNKIESVGQIGPIVDRLKELYGWFCKPDLTMAMIILIGSGLLYFIIAPDVIPDFLFPLGFIDDTIAIKIVTDKIANMKII